MCQDAKYSLRADVFCLIATITFLQRGAGVIRNADAPSTFHETALISQAIHVRAR
jgi:hypothetical protein